MFQTFSHLVNVFNSLEGKLHILVKLVTFVAFPSSHVDFGVYHGTCVNYLNYARTGSGFSKAFHVLFIKC